MESDPGPHDPRREQIRRVAKASIHRRHSGETLTDEQIIAEHPDLMPELAEELRRLALVQRAGKVAIGDSTRQAVDGLEALYDSSDEVDVHFVHTPSGLDVTSPLLSPAPASSRLPDSLTGSISGYEIVREIHRGGQGVVYQAIQKNTKRKVAIKVMREGPFAGARDKARFEREVQILGSLNHPHIVAIHDSGLAAGNFYFVMDYISGQPLDVYMSSGKRSLEETLRLFIQIGQAVTAAHLRGIIHRDLKPSNIRIDQNGEPHILDFGLAKMAIGQVTAESRPQVMTVTGQFVGSLPWASPEQAEGIPGKIDIRTDVYSLGVVLYEMLTGKFPYEVVGPMREVLNRILNAEPVRPNALRKEIDDEVETIVLKCLAKERERRYQSAGELVRDVEHYLAGEPIEAKRDSAIYMLRKALLRYKMAAIVGSTFTLLVLIGALWLGLVYKQRGRLLSQVQTEKAEALRQEAAAIAAKQKADDALQETDKALKKADDARRQAVAAEKEQERLRMEADDALEEAELRAAEARQSADGLEILLNNKGDYGAAESYFVEQLDRARRVGEDLPVATALHNLAGVLRAKGDYPRARQMYQQALQIRRRVFGERHEQVVQSLTGLAAVLHDEGNCTGAERRYREALSISHPPDKQGAFHTVATRIKYAGALMCLGKFLDARDELRKSYELVEQPSPPPGDLKRAAQRAFVELYDRWYATEKKEEYKAEADKWRERLKESPATAPQP